MVQPALGQVRFITRAESYCTNSKRNQDCINRAIVSAAAHHGGVVSINASYRIGHPIRLMSRVELNCSSRGSLRQLAGANVTHLIETSTYNASHVLIENCRINGNRSNESSGTSLVLLGKGDYNTIRHNLLEAAPGHGVLISEASTHDAVVNNHFEQITDRPISIYETTNTSSRHLIRGNKVRTYGGFGIAIVRSDDDELLDNDIVGITRVAIVKINESTVIRQEGDSFAGIRPGMHLVFRGLSGPSPIVATVDSEDNLTLTTPLARYDHLLVRIGSLEAINIDSGNRNLIACNICAATSDSGIVVHDQHGASRANKIINNRCFHNGAVGISLESLGFGVRENYVLHNILFSNHRAGAANALQYDVDLRVAGRTAEGNVIAFNRIRETASFRAYGIALDAVGLHNSVYGNDVRGTVYSEVRHSGSPIDSVATPNTTECCKCGAPK